MKMPQASRSTLGLFPDAPHGSTVFSRYVAFHYLSGNSTIRQTRNRLLGHHGLDVFGNRLRKLGELLPASARWDMAKMLLEATPIGFYGAALSAVRRAMWIDGSSPPPRAIKEFAPDGGNRPLVKRNLHFCPECVCRDEDRYGFAYWRVTHQLPGVHHCPVHVTPLRSTCLACNKSPASGNDWNPPSLICPFCKGSDFTKAQAPLCRPYKIYLSLVDDIYCCKDVGLAPPQRVQTYKKFIATFPDADWSTKIDRLHAFVLNAWDCESAEALATRLEAPFNRTFLELAVRGEDAIVNPASHLAILASMLTLAHVQIPKSTPDPTYHEGDMVPALFAGPAYLSPAASTVSANIASNLATRCGLSPIAASRILAGDTTSKIALQCQVSPCRILRLRREMKQLGLLRAGQKDGHIVKRVSIRDKTHATTRLDVLRARILRAIAEGATSRVEVALMAERALIWCRTHDRDWLDRTLPAKVDTSIPEDQKRNLYRKRICIYLSAYPLASRSMVAKKLLNAFIWCLANDRAWTDQKLSEQGIV